MLRPSPDRLDAQIRSLSHGQDQCLKIIMDEMKDNRTTIQKLQVRFKKYVCLSERHLRSGSLALISIQPQAIQMLEDNEYVAVVSLDLAKAFDTVCHDTLAKTL